MPLTAAREMSWRAVCRKATGFRHRSRTRSLTACGLLISHRGLMSEVSLLLRFLHRLALLQQESDQVRQVLFADLLDDVRRHW